MDAELAQGQPGSELSYKLAVVAGKIELDVQYAGKGGSVSVKGHLDPDIFIDKLAAAIPGKLDDTVLGLLKAALKM